MPAKLETATPVAAPDASSSACDDASHANVIRIVVDDCRGEVVANGNDDKAKKAPKDNEKPIEMARLTPNAATFLADLCTWKRAEAGTNTSESIWMTYLNSLRPNDANNERIEQKSVVNDVIIFASDNHRNSGVNLVGGGDESKRSSMDLEGKGEEDTQPHPTAAAPFEGSWTFLRQMIIPFFLAGAGMIGAGVILEKVQLWPMFIYHPEAMVLVPTLLGLKSNLGMTLGSRLSTLSNLGRLNTRGRQIKVFYSNIALDQALSTMTAFLASILTIIIATVRTKQFDPTDAVFLSAAAMVTASTTSLVLDTFLMAVVLISRRLKINPDNVSTPVSDAVGDVTTLCVFVAFGSLLLAVPLWIEVAITLLFFAVAPFWMWLAARDSTTLDVLKRGWAPVIAAMIISSAGGFILENVVEQYNDLTCFLPVINGVGQNLVAVQSSRLATYLHQSALPGLLPKGKLVKYISFRRAFFSNSRDSSVARVLLAVVVPGQLIFMLVTYLVNTDDTKFTVQFSVAYLLIAFIQVFVLLYLCQWLVRFIWTRKMDPDYNAIPYLTALADLLGTGLLGLYCILFRKP